VWALGVAALEACLTATLFGIVGLKRDGPCAETRFRLSEKRTSPFESAGGVSLVRL
jgi:hypothetical protein